MKNSQDVRLPPSLSDHVSANVSCVGVPRFISERRHKQVPLSEYFKSVDYDGARRDLKADNAASEEEEEVDDESEDSSAPHSSPKARRKLIPKKILVEDSVTGELVVMNARIL